MSGTMIRFKVVLNLFKNSDVPKMKLNLSIIQNICRIGQLKYWGGDRPSLIGRCQILPPIQQSSMQQCTGVTFQSSLVPVPVAPIKGLASMHFFVLQPCCVDIWQLNRPHSISLIWLWTVYWILSE